VAQRFTAAISALFLNTALAAEGTFLTRDEFFRSLFSRADQNQ
jgi:hypothetical protein